MKYKNFKTFGAHKSEYKILLNNIMLSVFNLRVTYIMSFNESFNYRMRIYDINWFHFWCFLTSNNYVTVKQAMSRYCISICKFTIRNSFPLIQKG